MKRLRVVSQFESSRRRLVHAKTHIRNVGRVFKAWAKRKPYKRVSKRHRDGIYETIKLKARRRTLPRAFSDISTDAIENLRAALDHATYAIAIAAGIKGDALHFIYFPFGANKAAFAKKLRKGYPNFPNPILAFFCGLKPYHQGNDTLWAINEMANTSKHKTLTVVAFNITAAHAFEVKGIGNLSLPPTWDRSNNEFVLGTRRRDADATYHVGFRFQVSFEQPQVISRKPFIGVLNEMASIVEGIIDGIEAEVRRIGLVP